MADFRQLTKIIGNIHSQTQAKAINAVNQSLTVRNWMIGLYIVEYEQNGSDRAAYGSKLLSQLANNIRIKGLTGPELSRCRQFYHRYPLILGTLPQEFKLFLP